MNKYDLVSAVAEKTGLTKNDVNKVIDAIQPVIIEECVDKGGEVNLPRLVSSSRRLILPRKGINPLSKKPMDVPESHTLRFQPSSSLRKVVEPKKAAAKKGKNNHISPL